MKKVLSFILVIAIVIGFGVVSASAKTAALNAKVDDTLRDYLAGKSDDEKVTISVRLDNSMSDEELSIYQSLDWDLKLGFLKEKYQHQERVFLQSVSEICDYEEVATQGNYIVIKVSAYAVAEISDLKTVSFISLYVSDEHETLSDDVKRLIGESDASETVTVTVSGHFDMQNYLNISEKDTATMLEIKTDDGLNEWIKASLAFYGPKNRALFEKIASVSDAELVEKPMAIINSKYGVSSEFMICDLYDWFEIMIPAGQIKTVAEIEEVYGVGYNGYVGSSPDADRAFIGGDPDKIKEQYGDPDEDGAYTIPVTPFAFGDADGDGFVTILDATAIQRQLASLASKEEIVPSAADVDGDGEVTILDATGIQRTLAGLD